MIKMELDEWRSELIRASDIVQDGDDSVSSEEREERFRRYVRLLDMVTGKEPQEVFQAIVDSVRVPEDYGAYERVHNALWKFPPEKFAEYFVAALPTLIRRMAQYDQVGRFLCPLTGHGRKNYLPAFNRELGKAPVATREAIVSFIKENSEWFKDADAIGPV
jgi:hypothetical protein